MNNKLTTPKSILIGSFMIAVSILYTNGFNFSIIPKVNAEVAGMDEYDLKNDYDFKDAVESIVEGYDYQTSSDVGSIVDGCSVYVDGDYGSLSC